jgi:hypothetical protein
MARHMLGGPRDEGRSSYQVVLSVCSVCGGGAQAAGGELVPVDTTVVAMAACDAQHIGDLRPRAALLRAANENASLDDASTAGVEGQSRDGLAEPKGDEIATIHQTSDHAHNYESALTSTVLMPLSSPFSGLLPWLISLPVSSRQIDPDASTRMRSAAGHVRATKKRAVVNRLFALIEPA